MKAQAYFDKPMVVRIFPSGDCRSIADLPLRACTQDAADQALREMRLRRCSRWEPTQWGRDATVCFASSNEECCDQIGTPGPRPEGEPPNQAYPWWCPTCGLWLHIMADLPNQEGFRFIGIDRDGQQRPCVVRKNAVGCLGVYDERDNEPCLMRLEAWSYHPANAKVTGSLKSSPRGLPGWSEDLDEANT